MTELQGLVAARLNVEPFKRANGDDASVVALSSADPQFLSKLEANIAGPGLAINVFTSAIARDSEVQHRFEIEVQITEDVERNRHGNTGTGLSYMEHADRVVARLLAWRPDGEWEPLLFEGGESADDEERLVFLLRFSTRTILVSEDDGT